MSRPDPEPDAGASSDDAAAGSVPAPESASHPITHPVAYPPWRPMPYGSNPYAPPPAPPAPRRPALEMADVWTALLGTIGVVLLGFVATLLWVWLAPRAIAIKDAQGGVGLADPETKAFVGADVTYLFITLAAGVVCAGVAAVIARHRGLAVSIAMAVGGVLAALLVAWLGRWISGGPVTTWAHHMSPGRHRYFIELQARPFIMAWPIVALVITFVVALCTPDPVQPAPDTQPDFASR